MENNIDNNVRHTGELGLNITHFLYIFRIYSEFMVKLKRYVQ
jgi:hypothetical protein